MGDRNGYGFGDGDRDRDDRDRDGDKDRDRDGDRDRDRDRDRDGDRGSRFGRGIDTSKYGHVEKKKIKERQTKRAEQELQTTQITKAIDENLIEDKIKYERFLTTLLSDNNDVQGYVADGRQETCPADLRANGGIGKIKINDNDFQQFLLNKLLNNFLRVLSCEDISQIICTVTIVAHGDKTMGQTDTTKL